MARSEGHWAVIVKHERWVWLGVILIPLLVLAVAYLVAPELVWNDFIWRYYVAPIEADAQDRPVDGITEGYNAVDTATYGIILVLAVLGIYRLLKRLKVRPGKDLVLATIPYILLGGVLRSLEDAGMFTGKAVYLFIAPVIYIFIGLVTILKLVESWDIEKVAKAGKHGKRKALLTFAGIHVIWNILYAIGYYLYVNDREIFSTDVRNVEFMLNPGVSVILSLAAIMAIMICIKRRGRPYIHDTLNIFGWHFLALAFMHALVFMSKGGAWPGTHTEPLTEMHLEQLVLVPMLTAGVTGLFLTVCYLLSSRFGWLTVFWENPVNLVIMYSHIFDAAATFTALQFFSYGEKHVVPNMLITLTGTPAVMFPLKIFIIGFVVYSLEVVLRQDLRRSRLLQTLVWIAIVVLGLAPGTRDLMRLAMGV